MTELTELTDEPELVKGSGEANRWTKYGHDRVYLNDNDFSGKYGAYIDLQTEEFVCEYPSDFRMEIEDGTATVSKHWSHQGEDYSEVVVVVSLFGEEDADGEGEEETDSENVAEREDDEEMLVADGGEVQDPEIDGTKLLSTPRVKVETEQGDRVFDDALDVELAVRDGDVEIDAGSDVWRAVSGFDVDKLIDLEVPDFRDRLDERLDNGDYGYVEEASRDTIKSIDQSEIDSSGVYLFECPECGHEACQSAVELRLRCNLHRTNEMYYHDDDGEIQKREGHSVDLWKLVEPSEISHLSDEVRDDAPTYIPSVWAINDMRIEGYGARDEDRSQIHDLIREGLSPSEAVDYHMTVEEDLTQDEWAQERGTTQQAISKNVRRAGEILQDDDDR